MSVAPAASTRADRRALIAGGGSGGHVFPGLAVAAELERRGWKVAWAGRESGLEESLVTRRGLAFRALDARPLVGRGVAGKVRSLATLAASGLAARRLVQRERARVVLGTGGYVSAPAVLGARLAGVPALLLEPNANAGFANRALSRLAREALTAHPRTARQLRCPATHTGVPVRAEFFDVAEDLPWGAPHKLLVLGGSQGAAKLNELLPGALNALGRSHGPIVVRHQTGERHLPAAREAYARRGIHTVEVEGGGYRPDGPRVQVELVPFLHRMAGAMAESHLIVSRAGAITLAEICAAGRPALLVPLRLAAGHQVYNARELAQTGAAEVFEDEDASGEPGEETARGAGFARLLGELLENRPRLAAMADAARAMGRPGAAAHIADRLEDHAAGHAGRNS
ncbi:MAG: UDP-N-acetylglucosamine--N-acetylmuramyl-(pentapeptide) pyrophosphoryl-undecaprenol N-acetylglucosamine transferase [Acidobacteriota bacterium]